MPIFKEIKEFQKGPEKSGYVMYYVYRQVSPFLSALFIKLRFSPNFITLLSMLSDFLVVYLLYMQQWILAGILVNLGITLDCCDGEMARYYRSKEKDPKEKHYGAYLDEVLGTIGFIAIIFFAGYFMGEMWIGLFAAFGLTMVLITSLTADKEFPNKKEIAKNFEKDVFGDLKGRVGFPCAAQRLLVSAAVIFASPIILLIFGILCHLFYLLKFWLYRKF
ncbi:MAG: CDP-alcohol phosphatidyltransferase family protein [Nanoarchaeota archaeon]|nr:CDP-alcohol phosphatidyltransferase family protein [Nanoarchaeota archaeon]